MLTLAPWGFTFSTLAMLWLSVTEGALLVYTMPIWATLLAWPMLGLRPTLRSVTALVLGLSGVGVLLAGPGLALGAEKLPGVGLALGAAVLFAFGTVGGLMLGGLWLRRP